MDDSHNLSRAKEVVSFAWGDEVPKISTRETPKALSIFGTFGKTTFATLSEQQRTSVDRSEFMRG